MGLPPGNWFLNSKEKKKLVQVLHEQFGIEHLPEGVFVQNAKGKVFLINKEIDSVDYEKLYIDSLGLYIGGWQVDGFRLSMEGAQLLEHVITKHIVFLDSTQRKEWLQGKDLVWEGSGKEFVIIKYENDVIGSGKVRQPRAEHDEPVMLLNYIPKARRLIVVNE